MLEAWNAQTLQEDSALKQKHAELQQLSAQPCSQSDMTNQAGCCLWGLQDSCW